jgi:hypothetical protein
MTCTGEVFGSDLGWDISYINQYHFISFFPGEYPETALK